MSCQEPHPKLTSRECEILTHLVIGQTNQEIAEELGIKKGTVEQHLNHI
jgi:DNA-binding NarL/FixJ family response regulator